jgi:hypothetical protein
MSFTETPFFFFTHGKDHERLIVDGTVYKINEKDKTCKKIQSFGHGFIGGCALDSESNDILLSHDDCLTLSLWTWRGEFYGR